MSTQLGREQQLTTRAPCNAITVVIKGGAPEQLGPNQTESSAGGPQKKSSKAARPCNSLETHLIRRLFHRRRGLNEADMKRLTRKASATAVLPSGAMIKDVCMEIRMISIEIEIEIN